MKTIIEPAKPYMKLLGKENYRAEETYRLMYFVVQAEVDDGLLLLHNMTKEMVLLSKEEQRVFGQCPTDLPELIDRWFLVPTGHDDCKLSRQILEVARMIAQPRPHITDYTIMTTSDCNADNDAHVVIQPDGYITKCEHYTDSHHIGHISREGFDEAPRARFKKRGTKLMEACEHCVRYPDCFFLLYCPNYRECYAEMPEMYEHMLQQDMKAMYQDYLENGVKNR